MWKALFWGGLLLANLIAILAMLSARCDCGGPDTIPVLKSFAMGGSLIGGAFALASLPCALLWRIVARHCLHRTSSPVWQVVLAAALLGSACYGYLDVTLLSEERAAASPTRLASPAA